MATPDTMYYTADMVRALIDEERGWPRYETIWGELHVTPAPRPWHQLILERLRSALAAYLTREGAGVLLAAPADISWGRDDVLVQPDLFAVPLDMTRRALEFNTWAHVRHLVLAIEVLSPSTARADRFTKRALYREMGVPLYWIIDVERQEVEVWTPDRRFPEIERERLVWQPEGAETACTIDLPPLFAAP